MRRIVVVEYDPAWPSMFEAEAQQLRAILGDNLVEMHHIGSTSVPGLCAKPIIDMLPVVHFIDRVDQVVGEMAALGYKGLGEFGLPGRRYFRKGGDNRTHHVHMYGKASKGEIERHLAVRDYLRAHPAAAREYGDLKKRLAAKYHADPDTYADGKDEFVKGLEMRALEWSRSENPALPPRSWS